MFTRTEWGLLQVHAYPFERGRSTWIVECQEDVWRRAGLDKLAPAVDGVMSEQFKRLKALAETGRAE